MLRTFEPSLHVKLIKTIFTILIQSKCLKCCILLSKINTYENKIIPILIVFLIMLYHQESLIKSLKQMRGVYMQYVLNTSLGPTFFVHTHFKATLLASEALINFWT